MVIPCKTKRPYQQTLALQLRYTPAPKTKTHPLHYFLLSRFSSIPLKFFSRNRIRPPLALSNPQSGNWSALPEELLQLIFERLGTSTGDFIRVGAVCKSWQILADPIKQQQTGPFLLLRPAMKNDKKQITCHLFDFSKNVTRQIILPHDPNQLIRNSWNEWILTCNRFDDGVHDHIRFLNLLSMAQVGLPRSIAIDKVVVSSAPSDPNCVFMAICGGDDQHNKLAFCKQGDKKEWKILRSDQRSDRYEDIIYFKGEFYAVSMRGNLVACDIDDPEPKILNVAPSVQTTNSDTMYLVESSGDLFLVIRTFRGRNDDARRMCEVYKLNLSGRKWQKVNSLGPDGDSALFVGHNASFSISSKDYPVKRDCIYFTTFPLFGFTNIREGCQVFNLKTQLFEPTFLFS